MSQRRRELGPAAPLDARAPRRSLEPVTIRRRRPVRSERRDLVVEGEDGEAIVCAQRVNDASRGTTRGALLPTAHRTRTVHQDHDVARTLGLGARGGRQERQLPGRVTSLADRGGVGRQQCGRRDGGRREAPGEHHVAVQAGIGFHCDCHRTVAEGAALDRRRHRTGQLGSVEADGVDVHSAREPRALVRARRQEGRSDAGGVRRGVGVVPHARAGWTAFERLALRVPRRDDGRQSELGLEAVTIRMAIDRNRGVAFELALHLGTGRDVADRHRERGRTVLLGQRRRLPDLDGPSVLAASRAALVDPRTDDTAGEGGRERADRGAGRQREDIGGLDRVRRHVREDLADEQPDVETAHVGIKLDGGQREAATRRVNEFGGGCGGDPDGGEREGGFGRGHCFSWC